MSDVKSGFSARLMVTIFLAAIAILALLWLQQKISIYAAPPGEACGYHALPCCPGAHTGSTCHDGSTCMPNQYCVFPVGYTPPPTPTTLYSTSFLTATPTQTTTSTGSSLYPSSTPTIAVSPLPTVLAGANCGSGGKSCCDPIRLIHDPRQSQAQTSREGYCYIPYRCQSGICTMPTNTPIPDIPSNYQPGKFISPQPGKKALPETLEKMIGLSGAKYVGSGGRFTLTQDVSLPLCPENLNNLAKSHGACILFK
jgi:hypothetical protein